MSRLIAAAILALVLSDAMPPEPPVPAAPAAPVVSLASARELAASGDKARAAMMLREYLVAQPKASDASEARLFLAQTLLDLGRTGQAYNELLRLKARDPDFYRGAGGPALEGKAGGSLGSLEGEMQERELAQVFVIPRLRGGPRQLFQAFRRAGVDIAVIRAFHLRGDRVHEGDSTTVAEGVYFPSRRLPLVEDRLHADATAIHAAGMTCYAWMTTRRTPFVDAPAHRDVAWNFKEGRFEPSDGLDLFDPQVVSMLEDAYRDLARTGVDGVLLQDDLALGHLEGFSKHAEREYRKRTGRSLDPARFYKVVEDAPPRVEYLPEFWDFAAFKRDRILDVAQQLEKAGRDVNPRFEVALNLYYETALDPRNALAWFSQDLSAAAARDFRWLAVMAYHRQIAQELGHDAAGTDADLQAMARALAKAPGDAKRIMVKLQSIDWKTRETIPPDELARASAPFRAFALCLAPADDPDIVERDFAALRPLPPAAPAPPGGSPGRR